MVMSSRIRFIRTFLLLALLTLGVIIYPSLAFADALFYEGSTAYDISTSVYAGESEEFDVSGQATLSKSLVFNDDGTKMFVVDTNTASVIEYTLSTAYDISTATYAGAPEAFDVSSEETNPSSVLFNDDGTKMFVLGTNDDSVVEYTLSSGYDVSTSVYAGVGEEFDVSSQEVIPEDFSFNDDGTKMFIMGRNGAAVVEYTLSSGYDVSTSVYAGVGEEFSVSTQEATPVSIAFNSDGTKMYIAGYQGNAVVEYTLSAAYDVSTATYAGAGEEFSVLGEVPNIRGVEFSADGTKMYALDGADVIVEYTIDPSDYDENIANDGSINNTNSLAITLHGDTFQDTDADDVLDIDTEVAIGNVSSGLTPIMTLSNGDQTVTLTFSGTATSHTSGFDVAALTFAFTDDAFTGADAGVVTRSGDGGAYSSSVGIDFTGSNSSDSYSSPITYEIYLSNPLAGAEFHEGDLMVIDWSTAGSGLTNYIDLSYSLDGIDYIDIATVVPSRDYSYNWTVPGDISSDNVRIRVEGTDLLNPLSEAIVDSVRINVPVISEPEPEETPDMEVPDEDPEQLPDANPLAVWSHAYVTSPLTSAVYYIDEDLERHPFIDAQTFFTWQDSFKSVVEIEEETLGQLELGVPMLPKPSTVLVKIQSEDRVYAVTADESSTAVLRWIPTEELAVDIYGVDWADYVIDVPVTLFSQFQFGADITVSEEIEVDMTMMKKRGEL